MPNYESTSFVPPAPVASVTVRNIETGRMIDSVPLLLDTGADVTLLPRSAGKRPPGGARAPATRANQLYRLRRGDQAGSRQAT